MKHLRSIFLCSLLLAAMQIQAQTPTFKWGAEQAFTCYTKPVLYNQYCYAVYGYKPYIQKLDSVTGEVLKVGEYGPKDSKYSGSVSRYQKLFSTTGGIFLQQSFPKQGPKLTLSEVDPTTASEGTVIFKSDLEGYVHLSPDKKLICVIGYIADVTKEEVTLLKLTIIDATTKSVVWEKEVTPNIKSYYLELCNNGNVIGSFQFESNGDYYVKPVLITPTGLSYVTTPASDKLLGEGEVYFIEKDRPVLIGTYKYKGDERVWSRGWYYTELSTVTGEMKDLKFFPYSEQVLNTDKNNKKDKVSGVEIESVMLLDNGEIAIVMQKYFPEVSGDANSSRTVNVPQYKIVHSIKPDGRFKYEKVIKFDADFYEPYLCVYPIQENKVLLVQKNQVGTFTCIVIKPSGEYELIEVKDKLTKKLVITSMQQLDRNRFLVFSWKSAQKAQFGIMEFK